jgi:hypothetical protein
MAEALTPNDSAGTDDGSATPGSDVAAPAGPAADTRPPQPPLVRGALGPPEEEHRGKFRVAFIALGAILVAAIVGLVVVLAKPTSEEAVAGWSDWHPTDGSDVDQAQEIADFVSANYRLGDGRQLVTVQAEEPEVQSIPIDFIAIRSTPAGTVYPDNQIPIFRDAKSKGIQYLLCGLGEACAIPSGEPSVSRQRLLRREALELALYTFRYIDDKDYVVVFIPPKPGDRPTYILFFERHEFDQQLDVPLRQTLPDPLALTVGGITPVESGVIDRLTNPHFFAFSYSQLQNQQVVLVLADPTSVTPQPVQQQDQGSSTTSTTETTPDTSTQPATTPSG